MLRNFSSPDIHSLQYMLWKNHNLDGPPGGSPYTLQTNLVIIPAIMPQWILVVHYHPVFIMIRNNFRILELEYLPIRHYYFFLLTLWNIQIWKGWHHYNIIIRILWKFKLCLFPLTTKTYHTTNILWPELLVNTFCMNHPSPIAPIFYQWSSINPPLLIYKSALII